MSDLKVDWDEPSKLKNCCDSLLTDDSSDSKKQKSKLDCMAADRPKTKGDLIKAFSDELTDEDVIRSEEYAKGYVDGLNDRPKGEWIEPTKIYEPGDPYWECSQCHKAQFMGDGMNFCPNCGADMRGEET